MKRFWIALILLAAILTWSMVNTHKLHLQVDQLSAQLEESSLQAEAGNWTEALRLTSQAKARWEQMHGKLHALLSHSGLHEIQRSFESTLEFLRAKSQDEYSASNASLLFQLRSLWQSEVLSWTNLL